MSNIPVISNTLNALSKTKLCDTAIVMGCFQPLHNGHLALLQYAATYAKRLIVLIGSAYKASNIKDPFSETERIKMIEQTMDQTHLNSQLESVICLPIEDSLYNTSQWIDHIQKALTPYLTEPDESVVFISGANNATGRELSAAFNWPHVEIAQVIMPTAEALRHAYWQQEATHSNQLQQHIPKAALGFLQVFRQTASYARLVQEFQFIQHYRQQFDACPYPPVFVTVDAMVMHHNRVLMIRRKAAPGQGLWALPGGFLDQQETLFEACLRELKEETCLSVSTETLKNSVANHGVFDNPNRSLRGRTITYAWLFKLPDELPQPTIQAADDAAQAEWIDWSQLQNPAFSCTLFEDHRDIIKGLACINT